MEEESIAIIIVLKAPKAGYNYTSIYCVPENRVHLGISHSSRCRKLVSVKHQGPVNVPFGLRQKLWFPEILNNRTFM